jgi:hypothetical protein
MLELVTVQKVAAPKSAPHRLEKLLNREVRKFNI